MPKRTILMSTMELKALTKLLGNMCVNEWKTLGMDELEITVLTMAYRVLAEEFPDV